MRRAEYCADFETTTQDDDCRVWSWGIAKMDDPEATYACGTDMASFFEHLGTLGNVRVWFHNLGFDGRFIVNYLLLSGYEHTEKKPREKTFTTLIDDFNRFYRMEVLFHGKSIVFADSLKKITLKLSEVAKTYGLEETKGEIDYEKPRPAGYEPTEEESEYQRNDVMILCRAMRKRMELGTKLTTAADCLENFRDITGGKKGFRKWFPELNPVMDSLLRPAYRGGYVFASPRYKGKLNKCNGYRFDVNSLYPWALRNHPMPIGVPRYTCGEPPKPTTERPLWVGELVCTFDLKDGQELPFLQVKNDARFLANRYVESTPSPVTLTITSVDWEVANTVYNFSVYEWKWVFHFEAQEGLFDAYVDAGMAGKVNASTPGERQNYKLWLNSLYGVFAKRIEGFSKVPVLQPDGSVSYDLSPNADVREPVYLPVGMFTTAYARRLTFETCRAFGERFAYTDTDSFHVLFEPWEELRVPDTVEVDDKRLGACKLEAEFDASIFLRAKTYAERVGGEWEYTCAGMTEGIKKAMRIQDFTYGFTTDPKVNPNVDPRYTDPAIQKLVPKNVRGGVVLHPVPFTISDRTD